MSHWSASESSSSRPSRLLPKLGAALLLGFAGPAVAIACSSSDGTGGPPSDYAGSCGVLASRCHGTANDLAKECHELGHDGDDGKCGPKRNECLAVCPEKEQEEPHDAGIGDAATDASPEPACVAYCTCMARNCSSMTNYPFSEESTCYGACAAYSTEERSCFQSFCVEATDAGSNAHACDHATGKLGLAECK